MSPLAGPRTRTLRYQRPPLRDAGPRPAQTGRPTLLHKPRCLDRPRLGRIPHISGPESAPARRDSSSRPWASESSSYTQRGFKSAATMPHLNSNGKVESELRSPQPRPAIEAERCDTQARSTTRPARPRNQTPLPWHGSADMTRLVPQRGTQASPDARTKTSLEARSTDLLGGTKHRPLRRHETQTFSEARTKTSSEA